MKRNFLAKHPIATSIVIILLIIIGCVIYANQSALYTGAPSDHFDGKRFHNRYVKREWHFLAFWKWRFFEPRAKWPAHVANNAYPAPPKRVMGNRLVATFVGHATVLLQTHGLNIITDPVWSQRASPVSFAGPKRVRAPGVTLANLPKIDVILVSHNHYDQLDMATIAALYHRDHPTILVGLGVDKQIKRYDHDVKTHAMDWGNTVKINKTVSVRFVPAQHWSKRTPFDTNKTLWGGFIIHAPGGNIYFAGDTGFGDGDIFKRDIAPYQPIRLALLPIGAYEPRWFMRQSHVDPQEAVRTFELIHAHYAIAIHFGTFQLTNEAYLAPVIDLEKSLFAADISKKHFRVLDVGESWQVPMVSSAS